MSDDVPDLLARLRAIADETRVIKSEDDFFYPTLANVLKQGITDTCTEAADALEAAQREIEHEKKWNQERVDEIRRLDKRIAELEAESEDARKADLWDESTGSQSWTLRARIRELEAERREWIVERTFLKSAEKLKNRLAAENERLRNQID